MAQSRLEKIGTIFTRTTGLLRAGAMRTEDKPIWYDVYAAFPPKLEPRFDRPTPNIPLRNIFYEEDSVRAKYQKAIKQNETINLSDFKHETETQKFIKIYNGLKAQGALDSEQIFATSLQVLEDRRSQEVRHETSYTEEVSSQKSAIGLSQSFSEAKDATGKTLSEANTEKASAKSSINIENLFKE